LALPSFSDWFFVAVIAWLFATGSGWEALLADGDTGWHIRAGEIILDSGLPGRDPFSFTRSGERWYAWEWLSEVVFAALHRGLGLKGVAVASGAAIAAALWLVFRSGLWRGANLLAALAASLLAAGASGIHFLARPHVFTLALLPGSLWLAETRAAWLLVPAAAVWANLHGGFLALVVSLALLAGGRALERRTRDAWRLGLLTAACAAATLANPYGVRLHTHMLAYLRSSWIREAVDEFQSPKFRSEAAFQFEILLFAALLAAARLLGRRRYGEAALLVFWAHAALSSVRHVPVFAVIAAPVLAAEASAVWREASLTRGSVPAVLRQLGEDARRGAGRAGPLPFVCVLALGLFVGPKAFPEVKFPVHLLDRQAARLAGARVFTSDEWGDYLLYRFHPRQRVFIDGRSDFYGPDLGRLYLRTAYAHEEWRETLDRYRVAYVLTPRDWPLAAVLRREPGWRVVDEDKLGVLFTAPPLPPS
jgi:hypothetical protein